jgi:hypothetical protein
VDLDDDDSSDDNNEDDIIKEALRIARELKAQKEQPIKHRKLEVDEGPAERAKRYGPTASHFGLWIYILIIDITNSVFILRPKCCSVETTSTSQSQGTSTTGLSGFHHFFITTLVICPAIHAHSSSTKCK